MRYYILTILLLSKPALSEWNYLDQEMKHYGVSDEILAIEKAKNIKLRSISQLLTYSIPSQVIIDRAKKVSTFLIHEGYPVILTTSSVINLKNNCGVKFQVTPYAASPIVKAFNQVTLDYLKATQLCEPSVYSKIEKTAAGS